MFFVSVLMDEYSRKHLTCTIAVPFPEGRSERVSQSIVRVHRAAKDRFYGKHCS